MVRLTMEGPSSQTACNRVCTNCWPMPRPRTLGATARLSRWPPLLWGLSITGPQQAIAIAGQPEALAAVGGGYHPLEHVHWRPRVTSIQQGVELLPWGLIQSYL